MGVTHVLIDSSVQCLLSAIYGSPVSMRDRRWAAACLFFRPCQVKIASALLLEGGGGGRFEGSAARMGEVEEAVALLGGRSADERLAGLLLAGRILSADGRVDTAERIQRAVPSGFLRRMMLNLEYRPMALEIASTLAGRCHLPQQGILQVVNELRIARDEPELCASLLIGLAKGSTAGLEHVLRSHKAEQFWQLGVKRKKAAEDPFLAIGELVASHLHMDLSDDALNFVHSLQDVLLHVDKSVADEVVGRLLHMAANCSQIDVAPDFLAPLMTVLTERPGKDARRGAFSLCTAEIKHGKLPGHRSSLDGVKVIELGVRLAEVELRVRLRGVLEASEGPAVESSKDSLKDDVLVSMTAFELLEAAAESLRALEEDLEDETDVMSDFEGTVVALTNAFAKAVTVIYEYSDALENAEKEKEGSVGGDSDEGVHTTLAKVAGFAGRVLSCFITLQLPMQVQESALSLTRLFSIAEGSDISLLLPGLLLSSERPENRKYLLENDIHIRLARLVAYTADLASASETETDTALMALSTALNAVRTQTPTQFNHKELRRLVAILLPVLNNPTGTSDDLTEEVTRIIQLAH